MTCENNNSALYAITSDNRLGGSSSPPSDTALSCENVRDSFRVRGDRSGNLYRISTERRRAERECTVANPEWRNYEAQIHDALKSGVAADADVLFDQRLPGRFSGIERQVDVVVRGRFAGLPGDDLMIVDCKLITRRLGVTHVEKFAGLLEDVGVGRGLLFTGKGFSASAKRRAEHVRGMKIDVVPFDKLAVFRGATGWTVIAPDPDLSTATISLGDSDGVLHTHVVGNDVVEAYWEAFRKGTLPQQQ